MAWFIARPAASYIESEKDDVSILDDVVLAFQPQLSGFLDVGFRAVLDEIIDSIHLGLYEALLEIGVDDAGALRSLGA